MDKGNVHVHRKYCSALKKKAVLSFAPAWMELEIITLNEISCIERQILHDMWNLKKIELTEVESRMMVTKDWGQKEKRLVIGHRVLVRQED